MKINDDKKVPGVISGEEGALIKESILLPMILTLLERDRKRIEAAPKLRFSRVYLEEIQRIMDAITHDLSVIRNELRTRRIKVFFESRDDDGIRHGYVHIGYTQTFAMRWTYVQAEVERRMRAYFGLPD